MRRKYLRFKKWALLKMIYVLAAVLRFLKRQVPGGEARAYRRATGRRRSTVRCARRMPRARRRRRSSMGASKSC
jgi:hypothetical protein